MFLTYLMLVVALMLSAVAAFYSIVGLTAIFAAAVIPIIIMGTILEAAKLVVTVWLHEYWREVKLTMKLYLVPAVFTLMVITSMGIFGFLSKAHLDQTVPTGDVQAQVALIDEKINNERDTIVNARTLLGQLDKAVTDISNSADQEIKLRDGTTQIRSAAERALQVRRQQARDRAALTKTIEEAQARIVTLQEQKAPFAKELRKVEAEVGPIKYIAALIYGDNPDANLLEKAVRWVIIILVVVFDPLAIMMLLAATESMKWERERRAQRREEEIDNDSSVSSEPPAATIPPGPPEPEEHSGAQPDQPTLSDPPAAQQPDPGDSVPVRPDGPDDHEPSEHHRFDHLDLPQEAAPLEPDPIRSDQPEPAVENEEEETSVIKQAKTLWKQDHPGATLKEQRRLLSLGQIDHLPWEDYLDDPRILHDAAFGTRLPTNGQRGDMFVLTDRVPFVLYKFNGESWIEVDKNLTDHYAYNQAYIDYLIDKIGNGEYDADLLTDIERQQIESRLHRSSQ